MLLNAGLRRTLSLLLLLAGLLLRAAPGQADDSNELSSALAAVERQDYQAAVALLKPLADQGDPQAAFHLGLRYAKGQGVPKTMPEALRLYRFAAGHGVNQASFALYMLYQNADGVPYDPNESRSWLKQAAEHGFAPAQTLLGVGILAEARKDPQKISEARRWFEQAAGTDPRASYHLGMMAFRGDDGQKDWEAARRWLQKAAESGDLPAMNNLGVMLKNGQGGSIELTESLHWLRKSAGKGHVPAMHNLAMAFQNGTGTEPDIKQAIYWYEMAATELYPDSLNNLGNIFFRGSGEIKPDYQQASKFYELAAGLGNPHAWFNLAQIHGNGLTGKVDLRIAYTGYAVAAALGYAAAAEERDRVSPQLNAAEKEKLDQEIAGLLADQKWRQPWPKNLPRH